MNKCTATARVGCVEAYMNNGGHHCWSELEITRNCDAYSGTTCNDCGVRFCQLSPMRPSVVVINHRDYVLCAACQKPYALHRAHWTWNIFWVCQKRAIDEKNHEAMHELRSRYEANIARMPLDVEPPF